MRVHDDNRRIVVEIAYVVPLVLELAIDSVKLYYSLKRLNEWLYHIFRHLERVTH